MTQRPADTHNPIQVLFDYFERAAEDVGLGVWLALLRPGNEKNFQDKIRGRFYASLSFQPWQERREEVLRDPEGHLRWEPWEDPEEEIWAHYRMQSAIVATLMGDREELSTLAAQLITEPMNRKLAISYFLGNLTEGRVGSNYKELPTKEQVLRWVHDIKYFDLTSKLGEIAKFKYE